MQGGDRGKAAGLLVGGVQLQPALGRGEHHAPLVVFVGDPGRLLGQLFVFFFFLPLVGFSVDAWTAAALSLSIYASAFFGEIWRGSLQSVHQRQWEAGAALGLTYTQRLTHVVIPQAVRVSIAPTVGFLVQLVKNTSLTSLIGFVELTRASQIITSATFAPLQVYLTAAAIYFVICFSLSQLSQMLERKFHAAR